MHIFSYLWPWTRRALFYFRPKVCDYVGFETHSVLWLFNIIIMIIINIMNTIAIITIMSNIIFMAVISIGHIIINIIILLLLQTHIRDKWVCKTETNSSSPILTAFHYTTLYHWMQIEQVQRASVRFENLNSCLGPALDPKLCSLACWTRSIRTQQDSAWNEIGGVIIEMLVYVPQTC